MAQSKKNMHGYRILFFRHSWTIKQSTENIEF